MLISRFVLRMFPVVPLILAASPASAQTTYPDKPKRIVTSSPASSSDFSARLIAQGISSSLGQPVIVENRLGVVSGETVVKAPPDGHTLLVIGSNFWVGPLIQAVSYDPVRDFSAITLVARVPNILAVHPSVPAKSVKELVALAKARPGELNYATGSTGGSGHLAGALFAHMAGINIVRVSYKSGSVQMADLVSGQVQLAFGNPSEVTPYVKAGRLRALAISSAQPSELVPGLPTIAAAGVPGYESVGMQGVFAPARTSATAINRLNQEIVRFLQTPSAKERFFNTGADTVGNSPEEFAAIVKLDRSRLANLFKDTDIQGKSQ